ncbi:class I SAM-dependent methyltransferase [Sedimenticola selenatireducens]|uniref:class I SAM-dependent methyltransferase n=1 Tax=Sedimenticola selenatireducens TaxID=191960 RepID=UPI00048AB6FD|nr:class I SAM-dependent methyltransferase [Sedimenticola selenatireducens]
MNPADYDAWYDSERGRWIGETEYGLLVRLLGPRHGERVLDVGCGTGWFTRRLAGRSSLKMTGVDLDLSWLKFAIQRDSSSNYVQADALRLPFADETFDCVFSVTALCFIQDWSRAFREIIRVTRRRFAIGLLNKSSLLWREKGCHGGTGAYQGAHWHTEKEIRHSLASLPIGRIELKSAVFIPDGSRTARLAEQLTPNAFLHGAFLVVAGEK